MSTSSSAEPGTQQPMDDGVSFAQAGIVCIYKKTRTEFLSRWAKEPPLPRTVDRGTWWQTIHSRCSATRAIKQSSFITPEMRARKQTSLMTTQRTATTPHITAIRKATQKQGIHCSSSQTRDVGSAGSGGTGAPFSKYPGPKALLR